MIQAVLFDLDGTLANSLADLAAATNLALEKYGFPPQPVEAFKMFAGNGIPKMLERALPPQNRTPETVEKCRKVFMDYYGEHYADKTAAYDGVPALLGVLKARGIKLAVVTNKAQEMADKVVTKLYGDLFDLIIGKREGFPAKPDPAAAHLAMRTLGVTPQECLFVGDSGVDVKTGANSGAVPIGVLWGFRDRAELSENGAAYIIEKPSQILSILEELQ
ncbi:MAG: HAD family hydrolase [Clostridia bacterium]|nr:HAD family hydrolase [Clostridia bacterium]